MFDTWLDAQLSENCLQQTSNLIRLLCFKIKSVLENFHCYRQKQIQPDRIFQVQSINKFSTSIPRITL